MNMRNPELDDDQLISVYSPYNEKWLLRASDLPGTNMISGLYMWHDKFKTAFYSVVCAVEFAWDMDINLNNTVFVPVRPRYDGPGPEYVGDFVQAFPYHHDYLEDYIESTSKYTRVK